MWWVAAVSGADMNTTLAWGSTSRSMSGGTIRSTAADGGMSFGSTPMTRSPNAAARSAMADPAPPHPDHHRGFPSELDRRVPCGFSPASRPVGDDEVQSPGEREQHRRRSRISANP
jgi:hypothetical protein